MGAIVEDVGTDIDWMAEQARTMYFGNLNVYFGHHMDEWRDEMDPLLVHWIELGRAFGTVDFRKAQLARSPPLSQHPETVRDLRDFLVSPTLQETAITFDRTKDMTGKLGGRLERLRLSVQPVRQPGFDGSVWVSATTACRRHFRSSDLGGAIRKCCG